MDTQLPSSPSGRARALVIAGLAVASVLAWLCVRVNLERACAVLDTPYLPVCQDTSPATVSPERLRERIAANPGDANAYVRLALATRSTPALTAAVLAAPNQPSVLMLQAIAALDRQDWAQSIGPLVTLVEYRDTPQAAQVLARLVAGGQGNLLVPHLTPGSRWLARVLRQMPAGAASLSNALPLIVQGLQAGVLDRDAVRNITRQLKSAGAWTDAYSLWLALHGRDLPALFNPGFDDAFQPDGFDWEIPVAGPPGRVGAIVERKGADERGAVLDIRFTGRSITLPMVRQHLFLVGGRWRIRGSYKGHQLRTEQGLNWVVRCGASPAEAGRSPPLGDTGGAWAPFQFDFTLAPGCGPAAALQLETFAAPDAVLGGRGRVAFDAFSLEKLGS